MERGKADLMWALVLKIVASLVEHWKEKQNSEMAR